MNRLAKVIAVLSLAWALGAPAFIFLRASRDEHSRKLTAMAVSRLGAAADDMTNEVVRVPRASVELIREIAQQEQESVDVVNAVVLSSSAIITLLAVTVLARKPSAD